MNEMRETGAEPQDDRARIAVVAHKVGDGGGTDRVHAELIRRLLDRYRFTVVTSCLAEDLREKVDWRPVRVPSRPMPLRFLAFFGLGAIRLRRADVDLVHVCGALVPNRADVSTVHMCHAGFAAANGRLAPQGSSYPRRLNTLLKRRLAIGAERWSYRPGRLRLLAPVSHQVADELGAAYPGVLINETPNGVDLDRFCPDNSARAAVRAELGTNEEATVALFVGGDWDLKGLAIAIDALAIARSSVGQLELWVLGAGDEGRFSSRAATAGVADAVRFIGRRLDTERYYQASDVYLCCSTYEAFSLALLEAAASGLPIVTTRVGGTAELLGGTGDPAGILVGRQPGEMADALAVLATDTERRTCYGKAARQRAEQFGWDHLAERVDGIYQRLLEGNCT